MDEREGMDERIGCNVDKNLQKSMALVGTLALAFDCQRLSTASGALGYTLLIEALEMIKEGLSSLERKLRTFSFFTSPCCIVDRLLMLSLTVCKP